MPDQVDKVNGIFHRAGAYSRFKDLIERKGFLENWYEFEKEQQDQALREWCKENDIEMYEN
jgi:hypothetical protein